MKLRKIFMVGLFVVLSIMTVSVCACKKNKGGVTETGTYNCEIQPKAAEGKYCKIEVLDASYCKIQYLCSENGNNVIDIGEQYNKADKKFQFFKSDSGDRVCLMLNQSKALWGQYKKGQTITVYGKNYNK